MTSQQRGSVALPYQRSADSGSPADWVLTRHFLYQLSDHRGVPATRLPSPVISIVILYLTDTHTYSPKSKTPLPHTCCVPMTSPPPPVLAGQCGPTLDLPPPAYKDSIQCHDIRDTKNVERPHNTYRFVMHVHSQSFQLSGISHSRQESAPYTNREGHCEATLDTRH